MNQRLVALIDGLLDERLAPGEWTELAEMLRQSEAARERYWEMVEQDALLRELVPEAAGRDLARMASLLEKMLTDAYEGFSSRSVDSAVAIVCADARPC